MVAIPKIIMQTWKTDDLPDKWKPTQTSIKKYMSGWDYILMTDDMNRFFIQQHFPDFLDYFDAFPYPIQRADAIRYAWLYIMGGLYFDCDFEILSPLDDLFEEDYDLFLITSSNNLNVITNGFIAAKPRNPIFLGMIEEMKSPPGFAWIEQHLLVMNTTGPLAFNRVVKHSNVRYKLCDNINPYNLCETEYTKPNALMKPLEGSSWVGGAGKLYQQCYCQSKFLVIVTLIMFLAISLIILLYSGIIQ